MELSKPESRMTRQRQVILEELKKVASHPTADEIYKAVRRRLPRISLGTIYRNLETLSESGVIQKLEFGGSQKRFDAESEDHYHVRCTACDRLDDIPSEPISGIEDRFHNACNYRITGYQLLLTGLCPKCDETKSQHI